jgi:hypothetical protein
MNSMKLANDVRLTMPFLFTEENLRIVPNIETPSGRLDCACVTVSAHNILFRFSRGREGLTIDIAPAFKPSSWDDLAFILHINRGMADVMIPPPFRDMRDASSQIKAQLPLLVTQFGTERNSA